MKIRLVLLIILSTFCINNINAQSSKKITITGTVLNSAKEPIVNAIVMIDGEKTNSMTDAKGNYKIKVKPTASKIGFFTFGNGIFEELINGRTKIDIVFGTVGTQQSADQKIAPGDVAVGDGYANTKNKDVITQSSKIDGTDKKYDSYHSIWDMIQRKDASLRLNGTSVIIQGSKDLFGDVPALVVVDGVSSYDLPDIPPTSVKSIEILKGTAAAIYGSRGYGGVIVIKTKVQND